MYLSNILHKTPKNKSTDKFIPVGWPRMLFMDAVEIVKTRYKGAFARFWNKSSLVNAG